MPEPKKLFAQELAEDAETNQSNSIGLIGRAERKASVVQRQLAAVAEPKQSILSDLPDFNLDRCRTRRGSAVLQLAQISIRLNRKAGKNGKARS